MSAPPRTHRIRARRRAALRRRREEGGVTAETIVILVLIAIAAITAWADYYEAIRTDADEEYTTFGHPPE
ncbi:MAG TPA: hypothetical protein RMH85_12735 [Polyangiaceae bacterium LLY-WYZ-15_(1-7)]|nr:hypothetical protein [Myxococcales bacterium]MAT25510.1 hypothetical protein [Sandaracinus sp.]HJK94866.1 hypothetical protein [Polyangiaceae bacterium LLY-WYZ-15_(1-7)]MBJ72087.1 hypothetical protein [Sandaracinus sp.]HJL00361.1 hypothetical protein [Polyangiaceae bacterium LLY-WYZ-15_(1-7)]